MKRGVRQTNGVRHSTFHDIVAGSEGEKKVKRGRA